MKNSILNIAFLLFCYLIYSCNSDKAKVNNNKALLIEKKIVHDTIIKCQIDTFLNDYASIISGKEPVKYFRTVYNNDDWKKIQKSIETEWQYVIVNKVKKIKPWSDSIIYNVRSGDNLIYPFAGADFLFSNLFFENADSSVLIGLEETGAIMADTNNIDMFVNHVRKVYKSLYFSNHAGFFRTISMREELNEPELSGTIPILLFYISKLGYSISSLKYIVIDSLGNLNCANTNHPYACQIEYFNTDNKIRRLFYVKYDLADYSLTRNNRILKFFDKFKEPNVLIKSASYLMHKGSFSIIRNYLINNSHCILQDDSGIPYRFFNTPDWSINLFGRYSKTIPLFEKSFQLDLKEAYQNLTVRKLPFSIGYNINHGEPNLILLTRNKDKF
ncbi:MAG: hypothetical protein ACOYO1_16885 [Bacteroidales bacterium]